ncbi:hypothetical protein [Nitrosopumilus sp.]|uniref:hypothetical protein n=1 Tax=Nitrosopumilus sp. TaxID=2024843 RepID=UPI00247E138B|nr:hypothetical protein [Nitrosopumilus sp.]MCV0431837.1 hypothetical protein [Nitrosopumilus sp.]
MKTRYKIIIIVPVVILSILFVPPNIAGFACNVLDIKDNHCYVVGMTFFGVYFMTNYWTLSGLEDPIPCGGFFTEPGKVYTCSKPLHYWGYPEQT